MKFKYKTKKLFKNISLGLLGLGAVGAIGVGSAKIVEYAKNDLNTIHPSFEVGALGNDGEYVSNDLSLYTKDSFRCDGLQAKLDFDSDISYQFFYYDDLGNFMDKTETYTNGQSFIPLGTYARCVITPLNDDDGKISLKERVTYPSQLDIKVSKKQDSRFYNVYNKNFLSVNKFSDLIFEHGTITIDDDNNFVRWEELTSYCFTSKQVLSVKYGDKFKYVGTTNDVDNPYLKIYLLSGDDTNLSIVETHYISKTDTEFTITNRDVRFCLVEGSITKNGEHFDLTTDDISTIKSSISFIQR